MKVYIDSIKRTDHLSDPVQQSDNGTVIGSKWVFKWKRNLDGTVEWYRARLIGQGFSQVFGLDFFGTYAPVAKLKKLRVVYADVFDTCLAECQGSFHECTPVRRSVH